LISRYVPELKGGHMNDSLIKIRLMKADDFDAVVGIVMKVSSASRKPYYDLKFEKLFRSIDYLPVSIVAEKDDGTLAGFIMGELYQGEDGIFPDEATIDAICVDPDCRHKGIGGQLMMEFSDHLRKVGVQKLNTLADPNNPKIIQFFRANKFSPSKKINLERNL
jgi:ribosomal protein S18 acetylase RimI-like enzyme